MSEPAVHAVFQAIAARYPGQEAIAGEAGRLTYRQIAELAAKCASAIRRRPGPEPVAFCLRDDGRLPALFLGAMQSGRPYLYLDPADAPALRGAMIEKNGAALLIGDYVNARFGIPVVGFDEILASDEERNPPEVAATAPCCLIHTGGTTGKSRAVAVSHRTLLHNVENFRRTLAIAPEDRLSLLASPKFGAANSAILGALLSGACLCPFDIKARGFSEWIEWIRGERITILHTTPSLFRLLARYVTPDFFPGLRAIKLGGEPAYCSDAQLFREKFPGACVLVNGLGMSEAGGNICHFEVPRDFAGEGEMMPVGRPLEGHQVEIVDAEGKPVGGGEEGEIVVRSRFLADGYWNDPEATGQAFRAGESGAGERELRTGDVGRILADGSLVHLGRRDRLVKVRGFRVDLNLVEGALLALAGVKNAAVALADLPGHQKVIEAWVQPAAGGGVDGAAMREALRGTLADYMIPQRIHLVAALPLTGGGKIDRGKLPEMSASKRGKQGRGVGPRTPFEERLQALWQVILKREDFGIYDNFFELGGDSLQAMEFVARLSVELGTACWSGLLTLNPTIARLAEAVEGGTIGTESFEPDFRVLKASMLKLREGKGSAPLVFLPGGFTSETELAAFAGLAPYLDRKAAVWGIKLNLLAKGVRRPRSLGEIADLVAKEIAAAVNSRALVLIGECLASVLALEVAARLGKSGGVPPKVVLLDPWQPRVAAPRQPAASHPAAIVRYYRVLRSHRPGRHAGEFHLVCCETSERAAEDCRAWWQRATQGEPFLHVVPGDHDWYLRRYRQVLGGKLNEICCEPDWFGGLMKRIAGK